MKWLGLIAIWCWFSPVQGQDLRNVVGWSVDQFALLNWSDFHPSGVNNKRWSWSQLSTALEPSSWYANRSSIVLGSPYSTTHLSLMVSGKNDWQLWGIQLGYLHQIYQEHFVGIQVYTSSDLQNPESQWNTTTSLRYLGRTKRWMARVEWADVIAYSTSKFNWNQSSLSIQLGYQGLENYTVGVSTESNAIDHQRLGVFFQVNFHDSKLYSEVLSDGYIRLYYTFNCRWFQVLLGTDLGWGLPARPTLGVYGYVEN